MLPPGMPKYSLGFGILDWCSEMLSHPGGPGGSQGATWVFTPEQAMHLLWFYQIDEFGEWTYRKSLLGRPKGWGKSPFVATMAAAELLGPVRPKLDGDGHIILGPNGHPVGVPEQRPLVHILATSLDQIENSFDPLRYMLALGKAQKVYPIEVQKQNIIASGIGKIQQVTASPKAREGAPTSFAICDETHLWIATNDGHSLHEVMERNLAKRDARHIQTTNAPKLGEDSVAERAYNLADSQVGSEWELLFDSREALCEDLLDEDQFKAAVRYAYGDATWVKPERLWKETRQPGANLFEKQRFYLNQRVRGETEWLSVNAWDSAKQAKKLAKTDAIALGFEAHRGSAALVATRLEDGAVFMLSFWERPEDANREWEISWFEVDSKVRRALQHHNVVMMFVSPRGYQDVVGRWAVDFESQTKVEEFWVTNRGKFAKAVEQFEQAVYSARLTHSGDRNLTRHLLNAHAETTPQGTIIRQETPHSTRYIVAANAAILSYEAAQVAIEEGALKGGPSGTIWSF